MEAVVEEVEAVEALAAAEEALGVLEWAAEDLEAEADPAPWGVDKPWTGLEADRRHTAGYEKVRGMRRKGKTVGKPEMPGNIPPQ